MNGALEAANETVLNSRSAAETTDFMLIILILLIDRWYKYSLSVNVKIYVNNLDDVDGEKKHESADADLDE